ncbi:MAG: methyltransferase domain-containing protein [Patescibacteria group bacterium]
MNTNSSITEQQRQTWNKFSGGWDKWDQWVTNWLADIGEKLLTEAELNKRDRILDVSTGTGEPGLTAAKRVDQVIATDLAENMVEIAHKNAEVRGVKNFEAKTADAESLPFSDNEFDAVICRLGVMYFANPSAGVQEMARVLKPGRKVALAAWSEPAKNPWATVASNAIKELLNLPTPPSDAPGVFRYSRPGLLAELLEQVSIEDVKQVEVTGDSVFESPEHYWEFVIDVVAPIATPLRNADEATREKAKQAIIEASKPYQQNGKVIMHYACWVASGRKEK